MKSAKEIGLENRLSQLVEECLEAHREKMKIDPSLQPKSKGDVFRDIVEALHKNSDRNFVYSSMLEDEGKDLVVYVNVASDTHMMTFMATLPRTWAILKHEQQARKNRAKLQNSASDEDLL